MYMALFWKWLCDLSALHDVQYKVISPYLGWQKQSPALNELIYTGQDIPIIYFEKYIYSNFARMIVSVLLHMYYSVLIGRDVVLFKLEKEEKGTKSLPKEENNKEMTSKKELLQLCKTDLSAQAANHACNKFNNLINNKVKALHLEGKVH